MKYFMIFMIQLFPAMHLLHAQKKLKMDIIKESGDTIWSTQDQKIYTKPGGPRAVGDYLKTTVIKTKAGYSLELEIQTGRTNTFTITKGSAVDIELADGSAVSLYSNNDNSSRISRLNYGCYIFVFYRIRADDFKQLLAAPVKMIRVHASIGNMDYEIKDKSAEVLKEQLERIKQEK